MNPPTFSKETITILLNKIASKDCFKKYHKTPPIDEIGMDIDEARGDGIPIWSFADTEDKFVLTPKHMGYDFDYIAGEGRWGDMGFENEMYHNGELSEIYQRLYDIGRNLSNYYQVWLVKVSVSCKGYNSSYAIDYSTDEICDSYEDLEERYNLDREDIVLFVFANLKDIEVSLKTQLNSNDQQTNSH